MAIPPKKTENPGDGKVTVHDVARAADVSPMTVSNFVNGKYKAMSESTRERVAAAVTSLGYRPQTSGRNLRYSRNFSIGLIIVDESPNYLSDGYTTHVVSGLGNSINEHGYSLQLEGVRSHGFEASTLLASNRTDALCVMFSGDDSARLRMMSHASANRQPIVVLMETVDESFRDVCCVVQNDRAGGAMLAEHVLQKGARKLLLCRHGLNHWKPVEERCAGIYSAMRRVGSDAVAHRVDCGDGSFAQTLTAVTNAIDAFGVPDAILAMSDQIGIACMKLLRSRDIAVPGKVMVTGYNAFDFWNYSDLLLTTVRSPGYELGFRAGQALLERLERGQFSDRVIELPVEMIVGDTT